MNNTKIVGQIFRFAERQSQKIRNNLKARLKELLKKLRRLVIATPDEIGRKQSHSIWIDWVEIASSSIRTPRNDTKGVFPHTLKPCPTKIPSFLRLLKSCPVLLLTLVSLLNCQNPFSPPVVGPGSFKPIARQTSPDSVLYNFKYAYEYRDLVVYENCLDKDFIFYYKDQDQYSQIGEVWWPVYRDGKSGDIYRTNGLFKVFDDIRLDTWIIIVPGDSTEVDTLSGEIWKVRNVNFHLSLRDMTGDRNYEHLEASGFARFLFKKSEDGWWRIVRWYDRSI